MFFFEDVWSDITTNHPNSVSSYNTSNDIYLVLVQSNHGYLGETTDLGEKISGTVGRVDKIGGRIAMVALGDFHKEWNNETIKITIAHELGHNFGLFHDFAEEGPIMSYNPEEAGSWSLIVLSGRHDRLDSNWLSERSKNWLKVHPVFQQVHFFSSC